MRFHLDEHVDTAVAVGLRSRGLDVTTTAEAGLLGAKDPAQLAFILRERRVLITCDADFLVLSAKGVQHPGIIYWRASANIGRLVEFVALVNVCLGEAEMQNHVEFAPSS